MTVTGTVAAASLTGSGAGLSNVNADRLDGQHATDFASATHNHDATYVNEGQSNSISTGMIQDGAVTDDKIGGTISGSKLGSHNHSGGNITEGTVAEARIDSAIARVSALNAHVTDTSNPHAVTIAQIGAASVSHNHDTAYQAKYKRTVVVSPVGTATENGTALLNALAGITDASATNPYLLKIEPGIYDVGSTAVQMKQYVDIEGSGELSTRIEGLGSSDSATGTVKGANNAELRFLTVENTGGDTYATAIYNYSASPQITHVTATASGVSETSRGIANFASSSPTMMFVKASGSGGSDWNYGVVSGSSSSVMMNVVASASGGICSYGVYNSFSSGTFMNVIARAGEGTNNCGFYNTDSTSSMTMMNVTSSASGGTETNYAVNNAACAAFTMTNVTATASGSSGTNVGIYNQFSSPVMTGITAKGQGGTDSRGVSNHSSSPTMINVTAMASSASGHNYGVVNAATGTTFTMSNVTATASGGSGDNAGIYNQSCAEFTMKNITATATGATNSNYGVWNSISSPIMIDVIANAQGGTTSIGVANTCSTSTILNCTMVARDGTQNYGVYNQSCGGSYTVKINHSRIAGSTNTIRNHTGFTTYVGGSQLDGGNVDATAGTFTCISVFDENYAALNSSCQ